MLAGTIITGEIRRYFIICMDKILIDKEKWFRETFSSSLKIPLIELNEIREFVILYLC